MVGTGVKLDPAVLPLINSMNIDKKYKYAIFKVSKNGKVIEVHKTKEQNPQERTKTKDEDKTAFNDMVDVMKDEDLKAAYILYDFCFMSDTLGRVVEQLVFLNFCDDDNAPGKVKMLHAGSKSTLTESAKAVQLDFAANEWGELNYDTFSAGVEAKKRK